MTILYILLGLSVLAPIYTYAVYPYVLRLFKPKSRETLDDYAPSASVIIIEADEAVSRKKEKNVRESDYNHICEIIFASDTEAAFGAIKNAQGAVVVITDGTSMLQKNAISNAIRALSCNWVGCVSGMVRKAPDENGVFRDGANWKYENKIKVLESNIGSLSGANTAIYIFKKEYAPVDFDKNISLDFYIPTYITERGYDVLFEPNAVAYEEDRTETDLFWKHVNDGASGYCSILRFWKLLLPRKGSFVFWSHRVTKWLVPFNMIVLLLGSCVLAFNNKWALILLLLQIIVYLILTIYYIFFTKKGNSLSGAIGKLLDFSGYFLVLNLAWFLGLTRVKSTKL